MTLEGEYYANCPPNGSMRIRVAILMTLEGEYYKKSADLFGCQQIVAILMTLEGEYYHKAILLPSNTHRRNPHDIGRRILPNFPN